MPINFNALLEQLTNDIMEAIKDLPEEEQEAMLAKWKRIREKRKDDSKESLGDMWQIFTNDSGQCVLTRYRANKTHIILPDMINGCTYEIGNHAFQKSNIESIVISAHVTLIGRLAFAHCDNLKKVTFVDGFSGTIMSSAFMGCNSLEEFSFPSNTIIIEPIVDRCKHLETIYIPTSVTEIRSYAFAENVNLRNIYFDGTKAQWKAINKGHFWSYEVGDYTVYCHDGKFVTRKKVRKNAPPLQTHECSIDTQISPEEENTEYIYCEVEFDGASRKYSYITDDESINEGDMVVVPIGSRNLETLGVVASIIRCTVKNAPYPPSKTKKILRKHVEK